ncbi:DUF6886 family protein [Bacillus alkalisoli]|uniref:DUF6886 family protein n=1 Tax=Bacillus alkalisoli TaxID=2011008 RepID=UPI000C24E349|nr:DUF6886 family protein [Bacillus alkalisoli]
MKLFHVSEEDNIKIFHPRIPTRKDLVGSKDLVWAINEQCLPNFLTPRDCPRVTYYCNENTTIEDKKKYISSDSVEHVVIIEHNWFSIMKNTKLYLYEFDSTPFYLQDENAGYYVSEKPVEPVDKVVVTDLFEALFERNVEVRVTDNLWNISDEIQQTSFNWSMCRMGNAQPRV